MKIKYLILIAILMVILYIQFAPVNFGGKCYYLVILSGSMEPDFPTGGFIIAKVINPDDVKIGDVIVFEINSSSERNLFVTHRVINTTEEGFVMQGDANEEPDLNIVAPNQVKATPIIIIPKLGVYLVSLSKFLHSPKGFLSLIIIPVVVLAANEIRRIWLISEVDKIKEEEAIWIKER